MGDGVARFDHAEERADLAAVITHLRGERFSVGKGCVIAKMGDELDVDLLAIKIALEAEKIDFEHRLTD